MSGWSNPDIQTRVEMPFAPYTSRRVEFFPEPPWQRPIHGRVWGWACYFWSLGDREWMQRYWMSDYR